MDLILEYNFSKIFYVIVEIIYKKFIVLPIKSANLGKKTVNI